MPLGAGILYWVLVCQGGFNPHTPVTIMYGTLHEITPNGQDPM